MGNFNHVNHAHEVCAESYVVAYMDVRSMTDGVQADLLSALTAHFMTRMKSLT